MLARFGIAGGASWACSERANWHNRFGQMGNDMTTTSAQQRLCALAAHQRAVIGAPKFLSLGALLLSLALGVAACTDDTVVLPINEADALGGGDGTGLNNADGSDVQDAVLDADSIAAELPGLDADAAGDVTATERFF